MSVVGSVEAFAKWLLPMAGEELALQLGVGDAIERLRERLERVLPLLADADMRKLQEQGIQRWAQQLRDFVYTAEDIIERYRIEGQKLKRIGRQAASSSLSPSCCYSSISSSIHYIALRRRIANKIEGLNQKLDDILKDMKILDLRPTLADRNLSRKISRETSSLVEPDLVGEGIEDDTAMLVDLLLSTENRRQKISVFAIVGMGGIGKTTLAQKIFNDEKLKAKFTHIKPVWVCVSQDFSDTDLLRAIITRAGGNPGTAKEREDLEPMLLGLVRDKKFFLVLDDVWDARVWDLLYRPLQSASAGSRVLVSTRDENVAMGMKAMLGNRVHHGTLRLLGDICG